jgi:hypothetical protein
LEIWVKAGMTEDSSKTATKADTIHKMATHSKPQAEYPMTLKDVVAALLTSSSSVPAKSKPKPEKPTNSEGNR